MSQAILPEDDGCNGWYKLLDEASAPRPLKQRIQADWLVIGAGFTGLAAARRLGELKPNDHVVLLEALRPGLGASGRNTGFVIDLPHKRDLEGDDSVRKQAILDLNRAAIEDLAGLIDRHGIDCGWSMAGKYQGALGSRGMAYLKDFERLLNDLGTPYQYLEGRALADVLGTTSYAGAIYTPGTALMQPAALVRGLARTLPDNVTLYEQSPVTALYREAGMWHAATRDGEVKTPNVLLGTNIYSQEFGFLKKRILPVMTFASMTRALTDAEMERFAAPPHHFGLTPADHAGTTLRLTPDRRLVVRNQYRFVPRYVDRRSGRQGIRAVHRQSLDHRYPGLNEVPFIATWGGATGLSRNYETFFGPVGDRVWASGVHQSVGVARGTISGRLLAELATGQDSEQVAGMSQVSGCPARNPPEPLLGAAVRMRMKYAERVSRSEL